MSFTFTVGAAEEREALAFGVSATGVAFALDDFVEEDGGTFNG